MESVYNIVTIVTPILCLILFGLLWLANRRHTRQVCALKLLFKEQQRQIAALKSEIHEIRSGTLGVGSRVQQVEGQLAQAIERQEELAKVQHDPQAKLYGHAMKMIELGASIDEIIKECDLPRAEAELLVSLHSK